MDFSTQLTSFNNAFKAQFGSVNFSQMLDRKSYKERDSFVEEKMEQIGGIFDGEMQELIDQVSVYAPDFYAMAKANCFISAIEIKKSESSQESTIMGTTQYPYPTEFTGKQTHTIDNEYRTGEVLKFSTSDSADVARKYWADTVKVCNSQFNKPSSLDVDIAQFNVGYPEKLVNFLVEFNSHYQPHTEL